MRSLSVMCVVLAAAATSPRAQDVSSPAESLRATVESLAGKGSDGRRAWILHALRRAKIDVREEPFASRHARGTNLVCRFGAQPPALMVTAHLDTLSTSPGANDNASGCAVLLRLASDLAARRVADPSSERLVLLVFTDAGVRRATGARDFLERRQGEAVAAHLNIDTVGCGGGLIAGPATDRGYEEALRLLRIAAAAEAPKARLTVLDRFVPSDADAFASCGLDSITLSLAPDDQHASIATWLRHRRPAPGTRPPPKPPALKRAGSPADRLSAIDAASLELASRIASAWIEAGRASRVPGRAVHTGHSKDRRAFKRLLLEEDPAALGRKEGRHVELMTALGPQGTLRALVEVLERRGTEALPPVRRVLEIFAAGAELRPAVEKAVALSDASALGAALEELRAAFHGRLVWDPKRVIITTP